MFSKNKTIAFFAFLLAFIFVSCNNAEKNELSFPEYNFIVANDLGRNGYYEQKSIAERMGMLAEEVDIEFIAAAGDVHHFEGVASVTDPLWMTNFELIYSHPELMIDWYPILGNHEYRGNTQACIDYSKISRRWIMADRYYTLTKEVDDSTSLRLLFIDTAPLIDKYRKDVVTYPDAYKQSMEAQLQFIDSVLSVSTETWKVVIGHHPVYAQTTKDDSERSDLQARLAPLLEKHKVDMYFSGHIHNFQHIQPSASTVDYIVNSSASKSRKVSPIEGTVFCNDQAGFAVCSVTNKNLMFSFINKDGEQLYRYERKK
jgi:hypothetical protein